jgi:hypothetical protein
LSDLVSKMFLAAKSDKYQCQFLTLSDFTSMDDSLTVKMIQT